jgi:hypothetical protein
MKAKQKPYHRNIPDADLIADLKRLARKNKRPGVTIGEYLKHGRYSHSSMFRRFGSWIKAMDKAGLVAIRKGRAVVPNEELIADLKRVAAALHTTRLSSTKYNKLGRFHSGLSAFRFGSWQKALAVAGLERAPRPRATTDEIFENLARVWTKLGRQPPAKHLTPLTSKYSKNVYEKRYGTWNKALQAFVTWANEREAKK